ncbi:MAG: hypothetical protein DMF79_06990 [Acidobacteria bacterium]|nr:MAG: hypothetical protein DMF79_06990 [Acidobacteriota bacterium]
MHDVGHLAQLAHRVLEAAHRREVVAGSEDLQDVSVLLAQEVDLAVHDRLPGERLPRALGALQDVFDLHEGQPPRVRGQVLRGHPPLDRTVLVAQEADEGGAGGEVRAGDGHYLRTGRAHVDFLRHLPGRRSEQQDQGPPSRDLGVPGPAGEGGDGLALGGGAGPGGGERVGVFDDDRDRGRGRPVARDEGVEEDQGARGVGRQGAGLEAQHLPEFLLPRGVGEGKALRDVVGDEHGPTGREPPQAVGEGQVVSADRLDVPDVSVEQEQVAGSGVVAGQHPGPEPGGREESLHSSTPHPIPPPVGGGERWYSPGPAP